MNEQIYDDVRDRSFRIAYFMTRDSNDADEIAQAVLIKFHFNQKDIRKPLPWCNKTTKNQVYRYYKEKIRREIALDKEAIERFEGKLANDEKESEFNEQQVIIKEVRRYLSREDLQIYRLYIKYRFDINKISEKLGLSYNSTTTKIYRMKRNLKANRLKEKGYLASKEILDYNTNRNIVAFIKMFIRKCLENDLGSLHKYMEHINKEDIPKINVKRYSDFEISIIPTQKYKLLLPYNDINEQIKFLLFIFYIDRLNRIKIKEILEKKVALVKLKGTRKSILKCLPDKKKGIIQATPEQAYKILKKKGHIDKIITPKSDIEKMKIKLD